MTNRFTIKPNKTLEEIGGLNAANKGRVEYNKYANVVFNDEGECIHFKSDSQYKHIPASFKDNGAQEYFNEKIETSISYGRSVSLNPDGNWFIISGTRADGEEKYFCGLLHGYETIGIPLFSKHIILAKVYRNDSIELKLDLDLIKDKAEKYGIDCGYIKTVKAKIDCNKQN